MMRRNMQPKTVLRIRKWKKIDTILKLEIDFERIKKQRGVRYKNEAILSNLYD